MSCFMPSERDDSWLTFKAKVAKECQLVGSWRVGFTDLVMLCQGFGGLELIDHLPHQTIVHQVFLQSSDRFFKVAPKKME